MPELDFAARSVHGGDETDMAGADKALHSSEPMAIGDRGRLERYFEDDFALLPNSPPPDALKEPPKFCVRKSKYFTLGQSDIEAPTSSSGIISTQYCDNIRVESDCLSELTETSPPIKGHNRNPPSGENKRNLTSIIEDKEFSSFYVPENQTLPKKLDLTSKVAHLYARRNMDNPSWYQAHTSAEVSEAFIKDFDTARSLSKSLPGTPAMSPKTVRKNKAEKQELSKTLSQSLQKLPASANKSVVPAVQTSVSPLPQKPVTQDKVDGSEQRTFFSFGSFGKGPKKISVENRDLNLTAPTTT